ncbi:MAG: LacI family DNA-binding transcriptional regulator [Maritimibacter sp.]
MTLKELSRILGLSPTTVSRALNGYPEVSQTTLLKVQAAAKAHGYRPNNRAQSLATGRTMTIGHVIPVSSEHEMMNPVFSDFTAGAGEIYAAKGYDMLISIVADHDQARAYQEFSTRGIVDGIIVHAPRKGDPRVRLLNQVAIPFVVHGRATDSCDPYNWVDMNNRYAFHHATEFLLDLGHKRIALINGLADMDFAMRRQEGYLDALAERGIAPDPTLMFGDEMTEGYGYNVTRGLLERAVAPTAILLSSIIPAIGARRAIEDMGLKMGRDVSVITHDDDLSYLKNGGQPPQFTATRSSVREAGKRAARMLLSVIEAPGRGPQNDLLEAELILGASTGPAPTNGPATSLDFKTGPAPEQDNVPHATPRP